MWRKVKWPMLILVCLAAMSVALYLLVWWPEGNSKPPVAHTETRIEHYPNGTVAIETHYADGIKHGVERRWYSDGRRMAEHTFVNGVLHGPCRKWVSIGSILADGEYRQGTPWQGTFLGEGRPWEPEFRDGLDVFDGDLAPMVSVYDQGVYRGWIGNGLHGDLLLRDARGLAGSTADLPLRADGTLTQVTVAEYSGDPDRNRRPEGEED